MWRVISKLLKREEKQNLQADKVWWFGKGYRVELILPETLETINGVLVFRPYPITSPRLVHILLPDGSFFNEPLLHWARISPSMFHKDVEVLKTNDKS